jgi:hypothetical protein
MKLPAGPFVELSFYFSDMPESSVMRLMVKSLLDRDAEFAGVGNVHQGEGIKEKPYAGIMESLLNEVRISSMDELDRILDDQNSRLVQIIMNRATGVNLHTSEILTFTSISPEAAIHDQHPIAIWTEGDLFSGTFIRHITNQAKKFGKQIYQRFIELLPELNPAYAAITSEWGLECPFDLRHDPRSISFIDFYVSRSFIGSDGIESIRKRLSNYYQEVIADGIYISGFEFLNPLGIGIDSEQAEVNSMFVSRMIANKAPRMVR